MSNKKYVPQGVYLACDKGTVPTEFKITNNNSSFLFDEPIANTGDMIPNLNIMPFGACSVKNGNPCMPLPTPWQGFEDGIFIGNFNPLLEDSVMQCGIGGKIEIHYSLEEAQAACSKGGGWGEFLLGAVLVVAAVALIVVTGGMAIAAIGAISAASGVLATTVAVTVAVLEVAGVLLTAKALYDYSQDGDEEALFKEVVLGFLFLGAGKVLEKGFSAWKAAKAGDEVVEVVDDVIRTGDEVTESIDDAFDAATATNKQKGNFGEIKAADNLLNNQAIRDAGYDLTRIGDDVPASLDDTIKKGVDGIYENATPPPNFVIDEAKYGTSRLSTLADGTKQMSDDWITGADRLADQVGPEKAREIMDALDSGNVDRVLSNIDDTGNVTTKLLDGAGNIIGNWP